MSDPGDNFWPMAPTKTQRWLDLLCLMVGRRVPVSVDEIMEEVPAYREKWSAGDDTARASVRRMFERDKDELRRMGIPLETRRFRVEGFTESEGYLILRRDLYLPYLRLIASEPGSGEQEGESPGASFPSPHAPGRVTLREEELATARDALREVLSLPSFPFRREARTALGKLTFDLDPALRTLPDEDPDTGPVLRILDRPGGADPEGVLETVLDALYDRRILRFRYHSIGRDRVEEREAEPWGLLFQWGAWYLVARDPTKDDGSQIRLFRADRMAGAHLARPGAAGPDFQVSDSFDVREFAGRRAWELEEEDGDELEVFLRFGPSAALLAARNGWGELEAEEDDGSAVRRFRVRRLEPFLRWVLSMAGEARVDSPPEAAAGLARMAGRIRDVHQEVP
jgi:proteasome accessory factor B